MSVYGELVGRYGLGDSHHLMLAAVPAGARVLDVGCADGYVAATLAERGCEVVGVELSEASAARARPHLAELVVGDVQDPATRAAAEEAGLRPARESGGDDAARPFDVVLFGDVLEHLADPLPVLRWAAGVAGRVVVSLPNIAHWSARRQLLRGRFPQEDFGLFDRTHLHFYTRTTAHELVEAAGLRVESEAFTRAFLPLQSRVPALGRFQPALLRARPELFALQFVLTCGSRAAR